MKIIEKVLVVLVFNDVFVLSIKGNIEGTNEEVINYGLKLVFLNYFYNFFGVVIFDFWVLFKFLGL